LALHHFVETVCAVLVESLTFLFQLFLLLLKSLFFRSQLCCLLNDPPRKGWLPPVVAGVLVAGPLPSLLSAEQKLRGCVTRKAVALPS
jgi:hypothetical protein